MRISADCNKQIYFSEIANSTQKSMSNWDFIFLVLTDTKSDGFLFSNIEQNDNFW